MDNIAFYVFGVDCEDDAFNGALLHYSRKKIIIKKLTHENVKPLYIKENPLVVSALDTKDLLIREITVPKRSKQDVLTTLSFQVEGFLPYPLENASLQFYPLEIQKKSARYLSLSVKKEKVEEHLQKMKTYELFPEMVTCQYMALLELSKHLVLQDSISILLSLKKQGTQILFLQGTKYLASRYIDLGSDDLTDHLTVTKWQRELQKILFSMQLDSLTTITVLGNAFQNDLFFQTIQEGFSKTFLKATAKPSLEITQNELLSFGLALGLALNALFQVQYQINFCSKEHLPHPLKRLKKPIQIYLTLALLFAFILASIGYYFIFQQRERLAQKAQTLLEWKYDFFEVHKKTHSSSEKDIASLLQQLDFIDPNSSYPYKLSSNAPTVCDFLCWLNKMPLNSSIHIEKLHYALVKYPHKGALQEPYQAKVEIEFKSSSRRLLEEIQERLSEPNEMYYHDKEFRIIPFENGCKVSFILKNVSNT